MAQEMRVGGGGFGFGTAYANAANASRQLALQEREQAQRELQALAQLQLQRQAAAQAQANNVQQMGLQYAQLGAQQNNARMQAGMGILNQRAEAEQAQREMDFRSREAMAQRDFQAQQSGAEMGFKAEQEDLNRQVQMAEVAGRRDEAEALRKQTQAIKDREFTYLKEKDKQELEEKKAKREEDRRAREMLLDEKKTEARANNLLKRKTRAQEILQDAVKYGDEPMIAKAKAALDKVTEEEDQMIRDAERADQIGEEEVDWRQPKPAEGGELDAGVSAERFAQGIVKERGEDRAQKATRAAAELAKAEADLAESEERKQLSALRREELRAKIDRANRTAELGVDPEKFGKLKAMPAFEKALGLLKKGKATPEEVEDLVQGNAEAGKLWDMYTETDRKKLESERETIRSIMDIEDKKEQIQAVAAYRSVQNVAPSDALNIIDRRLGELGSTPRDFSAEGNLTKMRQEKAGVEEQQKRTNAVVEGYMNQMFEEQGIPGILKGARAFTNFVAGLSPASWMFGKKVDIAKVADHRERLKAFMVRKGVTKEEAERLVEEWAFGKSGE